MDDEIYLVPKDVCDIQSYSVELSSDSSNDKKKESSKYGNISSLMHIIKGNLGTGILAMPIALKYSGYLLGTLGILALGFVATHCMHLLVLVARRLREKHQVVTHLDYTETVEKCFEFGPPALRRYSKHAWGVCLGFMLITQIGFCCVYVLFIAQNIEDFVKQINPNVDISLHVWEALVMILLIPYVFIKDLKLMAPFSLFANIVTAIGLVLIFTYCIQDIPDWRQYDAVKPFDSIPLFFGIVIFALEGITLVLPIENKMRHPNDFVGFGGVLNLGMVIVVVLYAAVGFYGYLKFGENVQSSITYSLPATPWYYLSVKLLFAVALFISYGLQFFVPAHLISSFIANHDSLHGWKLTAADIAMRIALVLFTFTMAALIPHLSLMISLIGALSSSALALVFPPVLQFLSYWDYERLTMSTKWWLWLCLKNAFLIILGLLGFTVGTVTTLISIVQAFKNETISSS